jgi:hypothetical protein
MSLRINYLNYSFLRGGKKLIPPPKWERLRRPEILSYFANQVYGVVPDQLDFHEVEVLDDEPAALGRKGDS